MLALRLARGARPLVQLRRLLVAAASAGTGFLLLCTLGWAMGHPASPADGALRLAWCAVPLAATVHFALAAARVDPGGRPRTALSVAGLGPGGLAMLAAVTAGAVCALGSLTALAVFLLLRGDLPALPWAGAASHLLAQGRPLPLAAVITLLALTPAAVGTVCWFALRPGIARRTGAGQASRDTDDGPVPDEAPASAPSGLPWGVALLAGGIAVETWAHRSPRSFSLLPGTFTGGAAGVLGGWALTAVGLVLAGPGLTHLCGWALQSVRPGALRLLAGRVLQQEARRIGHPLGVVCAVVSAAFAAAVLYQGRGPRMGPLSVIGAATVAGCALAALVTALVEARQARTPVREALRRMGAAPAVLRGAAALRAGALILVFGPLTWLVAVLAATPLAG